MNIQSVLFDKNIYSYSEAVKWLMFECLLPYKNFTITSQFFRFKLKNPDETKYNYKMEKI